MKIIYTRDIEKLEASLASEDITPKFREHVKQKMEESSPMDYREDYSPGPNSTKVRNYPFALTLIYL